MVVAAGATRHPPRCTPCLSPRSFILRRKEKSRGNTAYLPAACAEPGRGGGAGILVSVSRASFQDEGSCSRRPGGVALGPEQRRGPVGSLPPAARAGAERSSGAAPPPPGFPAGMLRLGRGLRRLGSGRGAGDSGRLPLSAEMPKKAGATNKASGKPRGRGGWAARGREAGPAGGRGLPETRLPALRPGPRAPRGPAPHAG